MWCFRKNIFRFYVYPRARAHTLYRTGVNTELAFLATNLLHRLRFQHSRGDDRKPKLEQERPLARQAVEVVVCERQQQKRPGELEKRAVRGRGRFARHQPVGGGRARKTDDAQALGRGQDGPQSRAEHGARLLHFGSRDALAKRRSGADAPRPRRAKTVIITVCSDRHGTSRFRRAMFYGVLNI